ncbi:AAA family ATPase [Candidatus Pacearchaeota archaeon]|nr:AAA family ATPase [Candidatus Pacearchaeota archaeon]
MTFIKKIVLHGFKSFAKETEILFDPGLNVVVGPNGSGKCLTGDSLVQLGDGTIERIEEIVNSRLKKAVETEDGFLIQGDGTEVICLDFETLKTQKKQIKAFVKRAFTDKMLRIKTRSGKEIKTTKYHPLFILKENQIVAARADELKQGIRIAIPRKISFEPEHRYFIELLDKIEENDRIYVPYREEYKLILSSLKENLTWKQLAEKIGVSYYVIKGLLDKQSINFAHLIRVMRNAKLSDIEILNFVDRVISNGKETSFPFKNSEEFTRFFGYLLAEGRLAESSQIWFTNGDEEIIEDYVELVRKLFNKEPIIREYKPNCWDVLIFSEPLKKILAKLGMASKTEDKAISNIILKHSNNKEISALLNGLYCGDGYVSDRSIEITTKSKKLAKCIEVCLLRLGITYIKRKVVKGIKESGFRGEYENIIIYGVNNFRTFFRNIKLVHKEKKRKITENLDKKANPNLDLIEVNSLVKEIAKDQGISVKFIKKQFPLFDAYCYNQCLPSRNGLNLLIKNLFNSKSVLVDTLKLLVESDIYWDEIVEIEEVQGDGWVYDLCVEKDHNFIANNIFVHNSNITDAICFVLGRLSIKSIRAAKAANLIYNGGKENKPAFEARVDLILDNSDKMFPTQADLTISRIVRRNGLSIYKLNEETKTRQEVLDMLAHANIDPYGFNIILQGEIARFVEMRGEERRKILEDVAGISVYEVRKEKSLRELEKTEQKLSEVNTILHERFAYMKNLDIERAQALKYKDLELTVKRCKASVLKKDMNEKEKARQNLEKEIEDINIDIGKLRVKIDSINAEITEFEEKIKEITQRIQKSGGKEQELLNSEISELKATIAGLTVRKESFESQIREAERRNEELVKNITEGEKALEERKKGIKSYSDKELREKKKQLDEIEEKRKKFYVLKTELNSLNDRLSDKRKSLQKIKNDAEFTFNQINQLSLHMSVFELKKAQIIQHELKTKLSTLSEKENSLQNEISTIEREIAVNKNKIENFNKIKSNIEKLDTCPVCGTKITKEHASKVLDEIETEVEEINSDFKIKEGKRHKNEKELSELKEGFKEIKDKLDKLNSDIVKLESIEEKRQHNVKINEEEAVLKKEIEELEKKSKNLEKSIDEYKGIEDRYDSLNLEVLELMRREEANIGTELTFKQRDLEKFRNIIKTNQREIEDARQKTDDIEVLLEEKQADLIEKEKKEKEQYERFQKSFKDRTDVQNIINEKNKKIYELQVEIRNNEDKINNLRIQKAEINAKYESLEADFINFKDLELLAGSRQVLVEKLEKTEQTLERLGNVNMRALEVYDGVKKEYDEVALKVEQLRKEKEDILKIIEEIDRKKKITFNKTLNIINAFFTENFSHLCEKGQAFLELENQEDPFAGGLEIAVKLAKGKYFDAASLSGGEQTLVAIALILAIQRYKPYCFYILDEIDPALDRRNSGRLASILKQNIKDAQYIAITHNDSLIEEAPVLYGVSMQEGVSKIVSLKL